jgi:hypothetical protein
LPVFLGAKLPELHLLVLLAMAAAALVSLVRRPRALATGLHDAPRALAHATPLIALAFPLLYAAITRPVLYNEMRHFLFVLPPLAVLVGLGLDRLARVPAPSVARAVAALALGAYLAMHVALVARLHPYEYVYYNALVGGVRGAVGRFELDYWGVSLPAALAALRAHLIRTEGPQALEREYSVAVCGPEDALRYYLPARWHTVPRHSPHPDFRFGIPTHKDPACAYTGQTPAVHITRAGALLGYVLDLRVEQRP